MKITKLVHSCLLVEDKGKAVLIDPGIYSKEAVLASNFASLDYMLITHEHADHFYLPLLKQIREKFPQVKIITNKSIAKILEQEGIKAFTNSEEGIGIVPANHEKILGKEVENVAFTLFNQLTHPGDSLQIATTTDILALPIQAPWGSMVEAIEKAVDLKPKVIIPIHDWHWKDEARNSLYTMADEYASNKGILFKKMEPVDCVEL